MLHASRELFQDARAPRDGCRGQYIHKALNATDPPSVVSAPQEGVIFYSVGSQDVRQASRIRRQAIKAVGSHPRRTYDTTILMAARRRPKIA